MVFRSGPTERLPEDACRTLDGFVRTTPKPSALVEIPIVTPKFADQDFPLLAYWHYGLGKAVAFTSDAGKPENLVEALGATGGVLRQVLGAGGRLVAAADGEPRLQMVTEYRDGKIQVTVDARDGRRRPGHDADTARRHHDAEPGGDEDEGKKRELHFVQTNSGQYEAEIKAEEAGSYFVNAAGGADGEDQEQGRQGGGRRGGRGQRPRRRDAAVFAGVRRAGDEHAAAGEAGARSPAASPTPTTTRR